MDNDIKSVGILYVAIGKYTIFLDKFYESCEKNLFPGVQKTYYVFTDAKRLVLSEEKENVIRLPIKNFDWPGNTLFRYHMFLNYWDFIKNHDFLLFLNANTEIVDKINTEELFPFGNKKYVVAEHPYYYRETNLFKLPYEKRIESNAYVGDFNLSYKYVGGGFIGARPIDFKFISEKISSLIDEDLKNGIIAQWHDESHFNKFVKENELEVLYKSPQYFYPLEMDFNKNENNDVRNEFSNNKKIIIIPKEMLGGHNYLRGESRDDLFLVSLNDSLVKEVVTYIDKKNVKHRMKIFNDDIFDTQEFKMGRIVNRNEDEICVIWNNSGLKKYNRKGNNYYD